MLKASGKSVNTMSALIKSEAAQHYYEQLNLWCNAHQPTLSLSYQVPMLGEGGTCSLFGELDETPFNLHSELKAQELAVLKDVQSVVDWVKAQTNVDWFGVYLARENKQNEKVLTKLAYFGKPSRAEFPLNEEFSALSNNVTVALTGQSKVINDVTEYRNNGGEYYTCDPHVNSELCLPIFALHDSQNKNALLASEEQKIVGIIDVECFATNCFDDQQKELFSAVCEKLSELLTLR